MPTCYCYVPECRSGYAKNREKTSFFTHTVNRTRFLWSKFVPRDVKISKTSKICEKHLREEDLIKGEYLTIQGTVQFIKLLFNCKFKQVNPFRIFPKKGRS